MNFFLNGNQTFKSKLRNIWGGYFSYRYLNSFKLNKPNNYGAIFKYSHSKWINPVSPMFFQQSKYIELFELASKSKFISASLLVVDISEVTAIVDSYREAYAKFNRIINSKDFYIKDLSGEYLEEVENCFRQLEQYCEVYSAVMLMASFAEEIRLFLNRTYINPKKLSLRSLFNFNRYDTEERLHSELLVLLDNYKKILENLQDNPLWKEKFEIDIGKLFAFTNTVFDTPEIYSLIDQQKVFK